MLIPLSREKRALCFGGCEYLCMISQKKWARLGVNQTINGMDAENSRVETVNHERSLAL